MSRKRDDVRERKQLRKQLNETCVKCCLRKMIRGADDFKAKLLGNLDKRVESYSLHVALASINLQGIVKHMFKGIKNNALPGFELPLNIFDQTVLRNIIVNPQNIHNSIVKEYFQQNPECVPRFERYFGDGNTFSFGQINMMTVLKNSLTTNLTDRIKQFLKRQEKIGVFDKKARVWLLFNIHGWKLGDKYKDYKPSEELVKTALFHREILGLKGTTSITDYWCKTHLFETLKYFVFVNRFYEENKLPCFNLTPVFSIKRHFITIDTDVFYGILRDVGAIECKAAVFRELAMHHYQSVFNIHKLQGSRCTFTRTLQTDGVSLVVHFTRPKNVQDNANNDDIKIDPSHRLIAIDPGRENIYYGVEMLNKEIRSYVLTRKRYYQEAGMLNARKNVHKWQKSIRPNLQAMSKVSTKGTNHNKHSTFVSAYLDNVDAIWEENKKKRWARQRLRLYGGKKRVFARFFKEMEDADKSRPITVAYGSASFSPGGKGEVNVPVGRAFNECKMYFPTKVVDEYRTTAVHYYTDTMLQKVQLRRNKGTKTTVRGLLWCNSTIRKNKFVNRDLNAALNIHRCALNDRPKIMTRKSKVEIDKTVGKYIRQ